MPETMTRTDSAPIKYHKQIDGVYKPVVDQKKGIAKHWNVNKLSSRENPLVLFTLASQASLGAFALVFLASLFGLGNFAAFQATDIYVPFAIACFGMTGFGLFMSTMHLGKPRRFYRGFNNWRHSPVCREGLGIAGFMGFISLHILFSLPANTWAAELWVTLFGFPVTDWITLETCASIATGFGWAALAAGSVGLYYMTKCYKIKARPFWNHWQVNTAFVGNALSLGALVAAVFAGFTLAFTDQAYGITLQILGAALVTGVILESIGLAFHAKDMNRGEHEGAASHYIQVTTFGKSYLFRNMLLSVVILGALTITLAPLWVELPSLLTLLGWGAVAGGLALTSIIGRALFYVLVIPTTMPGAFFWKNKGFEEHARDIGLADMPQVGVVPDLH
jgi:DMSO reductase anchor subunit